MNPAALAENLLRLLLLLTGLVLPGTMLLRALRLPWSLAAAFIGSATLLYLVVLGLGFSGTTISLATLTGTLGGLTLVAGVWPSRRSATTISSSFAGFFRMGWWLPLGLLFWLVVGWRLALQPLTGPDVYFRWSWLGEQIVSLGSLGFYPPQQAADFARYFWAESIPPGVGSLYAWAYACGGSRVALWTSPVVALQLLALHELVWRLGHRWGGEVVARRAIVLAVASPLLTWSVLIGQETGLSAVAVMGLVWALGHLREADGARWAGLAGLFAVVAASTREYGPAFAVTAVGLAALTGTPLKRTGLLALVALPAAAVWPLHAWLLTGNPVYSLDLAGWFPVNPTFIAWQQVFHAPHAQALDTFAAWLGLGRYLLLWALPSLLGAVVLLVLLVRRLRDAAIPTAFVLLSVALWFASVPYTAGGVFYSLRVLSPALALLLVMAAYGLTSWMPAKGARFATLALALLAVESLPKTLVLPGNPYRLAPTEWPRAGRQFSNAVRADEQALLATLQALPDVRRVVTDNASLPRALAPAGIEVLPFWSPAVAWLFDPSLPDEEIARRWSRSGLRYLVLGRSASGVDFVQARARWRAPYFTVHAEAGPGDTVILDVTVDPTSLPTVR